MTPMGRSLVFWLVAASALLACKKSGGQRSDAPALPAGPIELRWAESYKLTVTGSKAEATFFMTQEADKPPLELRASFSEFPRGTKVEVGGESSTVGDSGYWSTMIDVKPTIVKLSLDDLKAPAELGLDVSIQPEGGSAGKAHLPKQDLKGGLRAAFTKARDGGIDFGAGDAAVAKPRGVAVLGGSSDLEFIGAARTLQEVDWVALAEEVKAPRGTKKCDFQKGPVTLELKDATVLLFDRRTGKKVEETVLHSDEECPRFAFVQDGKTSNTVDSEQVVTWARQRLAAASR